MRYLAEHGLLTEQEWTALRERASEPNEERVSVSAWKAAQEARRVSHDLPPVA